MLVCYSWDEDSISDILNFICVVFVVIVCTKPYAHDVQPNTSVIIQKDSCDWLCENNYPYQWNNDCLHIYTSVFKKVTAGAMSSAAHK